MVDIYIEDRILSFTIQAVNVCQVARLRSYDNFIFDLFFNSCVTAGIISRELKYANEDIDALEYNLLVNKELDRMQYWLDMLNETVGLNIDEYESLSIELRDIIRK